MSPSSWQSAMSPVTPASRVTGGAAGSKGRGVVGEGGGTWLMAVVGWCAVNWWGGMVRAGRGECGVRTYTHTSSPRAPSPRPDHPPYLSRCGRWWGVEEGGAICLSVQTCRAVSALTYIFQPQPWPTVEKARGVVAGWKEGGLRSVEVGLLWEMGELFEEKVPMGNHRLELSTHGKS